MWLASGAGEWELARVVFREISESFQRDFREDSERQEGLCVESVGVGVVAGVGVGVGVVVVAGVVAGAGPP